MSLCDNCIHDYVCGLEDNHEDGLVFCADMIPKGHGDLIDKIKADIESLDGKYLIGDYGIYGENIPKYVRLWDILKIINKYTAESEE